MKEAPPVHQKHAKLSRPHYGHFHRFEWALLGAPCSTIQQLARDLLTSLPQYAFGYVDADHGAADEAAAGLMEGSRWTYTDKINYHRFDQAGAPDPFSARMRTNHLDAVLINGNHFRADQQIVIVHPAKEDSLFRKLDRLTNIQLVLLSEDAEDLFPFLREKLGAQPEVPIMRLDDRPSILEWFAERMRATRPPLYGLVLAGGKSQRMGTDKGLIAYHDKPHREHTAALLGPFCHTVFYSMRPDQDELPADGLPVITDTFEGLGPYGGLLSAFRTYPEAAWLTVATDLPLLDDTSLAQLVAKRNPSKYATAFYNAQTDFPEPLITIWEPRSYPTLLQFLAQGYSCPRKVLINTDIELVEPAKPEALLNVNKPEERKMVEERLAAQQQD